MGDEAAPDCTRDPGAFGRTAAAALGFCVLGGMPVPAAAARHYHAVSKHSESSTPEPPKQPSGPLLLSISIASQRVTVYDNGTPIASSQISTGMAGHPTPMGIFSVIQKQRWHHSNLYSNAPMPYMQRITWSGVALHAGVVPGYPASHGCIRLPAGFAIRLYGMTRLGARVIIARGNMAPYVIDHPRLAGLVKPPEADPSPPPSAAKPDGAKSDGGATAAGAVVVATTGTVSADDATRRDLPAESVQADSGHGDSAAANPAPGDTGPAPNESSGTGDPATAAPAAAEPKPEPAPAAKGDDVLQRPGQLSLFVSRRESKLFVRKGFVPAFDVPLTIAEPDKPLGTHIFTAASDRTSESGGIRWLGVSLGYDRQSPKGKHKGRGEHDRPAAVTAASPRQSGIDALDRIELPPEAVARLSPLVAPGTSLVISDHGLGGETGTETDFIVVTQ